MSDTPKEAHLRALVEHWEEYCGKTESKLTRLYMVLGRVLAALKFIQGSKPLNVCFNPYATQSIVDAVIVELQEELGRAK